MKSISIIALTLAFGPAASASTIFCSDAEGRVTVSATFPAQYTEAELQRSFPLQSTYIHVAPEYVHLTSVETNARLVLNDVGCGEIQWSQQEGQVVVRSLKLNYLVSFRGGAFNNDGVAYGSFEDGAGSRNLPATCRLTR